MAHTLRNPIAFAGSQSTGVGGLVLGGGYGWLSAAYGLAIDNLVQATVVTADGAIRTANASENADLFWAIRGAGSNFGVVTEFVLKLHTQRRTVFAGLAIFSPDTLEALLDVTQQWWDKGPSEKEGMIQAFTRGPDHQARIGYCILHHIDLTDGHTSNVYSLASCVSSSTTARKKRAARTTRLSST
ncbi:hypothetical protein NUW54_g1602 [Trametes sanguinea]|uniref:Uncharacterized protein n=1 Tax=Trametes sanguinea TaxID=158606 RepID=A0ACC1Q6I4_9APHY|nr:hypothetical protein NUW54_g1602 [Trametes sanguinea]